MRAGSLLVWDQEVVHGSQPNTSENWRLAQFIKAFKKEPVSQKRRATRSAAVSTLIADAGLEAEVTLLGKEVFGLTE